MPFELRAGFLDSIRAPLSNDKMMEAKVKILVSAMQMKAEGAFESAVE